MSQICYGYGPRHSAVRDFFFHTPGFQAPLVHSDQVILAVEGSVIVGGVILRGKEQVFLTADDENVRKQLVESCANKGESS